MTIDGLPLMIHAPHDELFCIFVLFISVFGNNKVAISYSLHLCTITVSRSCLVDWFSPNSRIKRPAYKFYTARWHCGFLVQGNSSENNNNNNNTKFIKRHNAVRRLQRRWAYNSTFITQMGYFLGSAQKVGGS